MTGKNTLWWLVLIVGGVILVKTRENIVNLAGESEGLLVDGEERAEMVDRGRSLIQALNVDTSTMNEKQREVFGAALDNGDVASLSAVAQGLTYEQSAFGAMNLEVAAELYHIAGSLGHVPAMVNIGTLYAEGYGVEKSPRKALDWFILASERGHQGSSYNCGLLLSQDHPETSQEGRLSRDLISAYEYFFLAYALASQKGTITTNKTTEAAREAHKALSGHISSLSLEPRALSRAFFAANIDLGIPGGMLLEKWTAGIAYLERFNDRFVTGVGVVDEQRRAELRSVLQEWGDILDDDNLSAQLSDLQTYLLLDNLQDVIGPLAGRDDALSLQAGELAEALAVSVYCKERFAEEEGDTACFNGAVSAAMSFYRRAGRPGEAQRVFELANRHPGAATKWVFPSQTPRVFYRNMRANPWWNEQEFTIVRELESAYRGKKALIMKDLKAVVTAQEGKKVRRGGNIRLENQERERQAPREASLDEGGFERIFTPHIGVRVDDEKTEQDGSGGWSEFGPLYDGLDWSLERCSLIPILCQVLKEQVRDSHEVCGLDETELAAYRSNKEGLEATYRHTVENRCGADTIVTLLRLRPGTHILPHCGTTNRRLILHFALQGSGGVKFRAGDELEERAPGGWVYDYGGGDGHGIIFDDSFEHEVKHDGDQDRFVILAVLKHPDVEL